MPDKTKHLLDIHVRDWEDNETDANDLKTELSLVLPGEVLIIEKGKTLGDTFLLTMMSPSQSSYLFLLRTDDDSLRILDNSNKKYAKLQKARKQSSPLFAPLLSGITKKQSAFKEWFWYAQTMFQDGRFSPGTILISGSIRDAIKETRMITNNNLYSLIEVVSKIKEKNAGEPENIQEIRNACLFAFDECFELHVNGDTFLPSCFDINEKKRFIPDMDAFVQKNQIVEFESFSHQIKGGFNVLIMCGENSRFANNSSKYLMTAKFDKNFTAISMANGPIVSKKQQIYNTKAATNLPLLTFEAAGDSFWKTLQNLKSQIIMCLIDSLTESSYLFGST
jgi:hypothetical protein